MANPRIKRKAHSSLVSPRVASWRETVVVAFDIDGTADRTVPLLRAPYNCRVMSADWAQELDVDGAKVASIRNATDNEALTDALDIDALAALAGASFVMNEAAKKVVNKGDLLTLFYDVTTAGTVAPGECLVVLDLERLDED